MNAKICASIAWFVDTPLWSARRLYRSVVVAVLAVVLFVISEKDARAEENLTVPLYWLIGGSAAGAASAPFLVADVAYTVQQRWLPPGWAISQIVIGGGMNATVAIWGIAIYSGKDCAGGYTSAGFAAPGAPPPAPQSQPNACSGILPLTIGTGILGVGFLAHGVASLVLYEPPPATKASGRTGLKSPSAYLRWVPDVVVTREGNTLVAISGVF